MRTLRCKITLICLTIGFLLSLSHCTPYDFSRRYVRQGNLLPESKISRLKIGMSKEDCAILMGTSLLSPLFNNNRWDYVYTWRDGGKPLYVKQLSLYFANNHLTRIERSPQTPKQAKPLPGAPSVPSAV
jgi:outer membrane protein assembly factor BamE